MTAVVLQLSAIERAQLAALVQQFVELLGEPDDATDPALARLTPAAYPDDPESSDEFRRFTRDELLGRRADDAGTVLRTIVDAGPIPELLELDAAHAEEVAPVVLDADDANAWMRTLTSVRLVLASRLGIVSEDDGDAADPRYFLYDWLGALLDAVVRAVSEDDVTAG